MKNALLFALLFLGKTLFAHDHHDHFEPLKTWSVASDKQPIEASFLMFKNGDVFLEKKDGAVVHFPLAAFSAADQIFATEKYAQIERLNGAKNGQPISSQSPINLALAFSMLAFAASVFFFFEKKQRRFSFAAMLGGTLVLFGFKTKIVEKMLGTDPLFMDSAFQPFKPAVATHWDATWFYVESKGIPDHEMMAGITNWQQQVPIPQCYIGANAWQIPLNPVVAAAPVPVNSQHFLRGAIAVAVNGLPIFNPFTNTGVDAFLDGQLDHFGGHCGRADDYHYHTAPLHLDAQTPDVLPIAFALDGFAIYGNLEPDGSPMAALDDNHGHFDGGVYHYHGTPTAPYMIGKMVGQVTEDATLQIIPQAKASPIRPAGMPLPGATITACTPNAAGNGYFLTYLKGGQAFSIDYKWPSAGQYLFNFISPTGTVTQNFNGFVQCNVPTTTVDFFENEGAVSVFPNPTTCGFSIKLDEKISPGEVRGVSVFDSKGKMIWTKTSGLENLPMLKSGGVYFLKIHFKEGELSRKIIVQ